jgi:KaiC/GvpD/RAD55 family RecA-like ATPase
MILTQNIPEELKIKKQWVGWTKIAGRKVPLCPMTHRAAKSSDPNTWGSFNQAVESAETKKWSGVGFVFTRDYVGIDLDHCIENSNINDYASGVLKKCFSYTEVSPSKTGIHIIAKGDIPRALKTDKIEIYNTGRYFTMTGNIFQGRKNIRPVDVSEYYNGGSALPQSITQKLTDMRPGNVDLTLTSLAGKLFKRGLSYQDVFALLKEKANQAGHDDIALQRICRSVARYHIGENNGLTRMEREEEAGSKPIEVFSPATHSSEFIRQLNEKREDTTELPTGFPTIDKYTGGLKKGSIWVVGARTGIGKTSFSATIAANLLANNKRVLIFSTEMDWIDTFARFAAMGTGISLHKITNARAELTDENRKKLEGYAGTLKSKPLYVIQEPEPSLRVVSEEISRIRPDVFIFDHIQRVANQRDQRYLELAKFIKGLNTLCRTHNCAGIVNSQLNRAADHEIPALHHLKECGALEEEAHTVILLSVLSVSPQSDSIIIADVAKNRGLKGKVELKFHGLTAKFEETNEI